MAQSDQSAAQQDVEQSEQATSQQGADKEGTPPKLRLKPNDVLIFEEVIGPETGHPGDAGSQTPPCRAVNRRRGGN